MGGDSIWFWREKVLSNSSGLKSGLDYHGYVRFQDRCGLSIEVSDLFTLEPLSLMLWQDYDNCTTCAESEDLCGVLDEILFTLEDVDAEAQITPERLRLVNLVQWAALKCSRSLTRFAAEAATSETPARIASERRSVEEAGEVGQKAPTHLHLPRHIEDSSSMEEGETSAEESSVEIDSAKSGKSVIAQSSPAAKAAESACAPESSQKDDGFTTVGRNGKRIAPIVIDAQSNATELFTQIGNLCSNTSLQGRFENGKLRVFPTSAEEHRIIQRFVSDKKMRSHTFEMAHNKQLKVVLRGLPTDYNQGEHMSELTTLGFKPNHISLLRNRKTNTNMPLFLVTLLRNPEKSRPDCLPAFFPSPRRRSASLERFEFRDILTRDTVMSGHENQRAPEDAMQLGTEILPAALEPANLQTDDFIEIETFDKDCTDASQLSALIKEKANTELEYATALGELKVLYPCPVKSCQHNKGNGINSFRPKIKDLLNPLFSRQP
ncbi:RNA-directed DNA polymerase from mobile element jockey [Trichonephila clavipes]|nr:RNA-directed DNA polymerase from mobile element jockey [Trichonephila clavipes]